MQELIMNSSSDATYTTEQKVTAILALAILSGCPGITIAPYTVSLQISGVPNAITRPIIQSLVIDLTVLQQSTTARIRHAAIRALSCLACIRRDHEMNATVPIQARTSAKQSLTTTAAAGELNIRTFKLPAENTLVSTLLIGLLTTAGASTETTAVETSSQQSMTIAAPVLYATAVLQALKHCKLRVSESQLALVLSTLFRKSDSASNSDTAILQSAVLEYTFTTISRDNKAGSTSASTSWLINSIALQRGSLASMSYTAQTTLLTHFHQLDSLLLRSGQLLEAMNMLWSQCYTLRNTTAAREGYTAHQHTLIQVFLSSLATMLQQGGQYVAILRPFVIETITNAMLSATSKDSMFGAVGADIWSNVATCISLLYHDAESDTTTADTLDSWLHEHIQTQPSSTVVWLIAKLGELGVWHSLSSSTTATAITASPLYIAVKWGCDVNHTCADGATTAAIDSQLIKALRQTSAADRQKWLMLILDNLVSAATDNDSSAKHSCIKQLCLAASAWRYSILFEVLTSAVYSVSICSSSSSGAYTDVQTTVLIPALIELVCRKWSECSNTVITQLLKAYTVTTDTENASSDTASAVFEAVLIRAIASCKHAAAVVDGRVSNYAAAAAHISIAHS
jgi:hypothetical protein